MTTRWVEREGALPKGHSRALALSALRVRWCRGQTRDEEQSLMETIEEHQVFLVFNTLTPPSDGGLCPQTEI